MQKGPPYPEQSVGPTNELPSTSAFPPVSDTVAHCVGCEPSPKVSYLIWIGDVPAHAGALKDWQIVSPGMQNCDAGEVNGEVWPISHTNELGVSFTSPQPSALPISCLSYAGSSGPSALLRTIVPEPPVASSVTSMCQPSCCETTWKCRSIVSPACMSSGWCLAPVVSMALNAAGSWMTGFWPVVWMLQTGEQTEYVF